MKSGLFLYIAHPDFFYCAARENTEYFQKMTKEVIDAALKYGAVLEINIHGLFRNNIRHGVSHINYPTEHFWKEVAKTNIRVVLGGDFHDPAEIIREDALKQVYEMINKYNIRIVDIEEIYKEYKERIKKILK